MICFGLSTTTKKGTAKCRSLLERPGKKRWEYVYTVTILYNMIYESHISEL